MSSIKETQIEKDLIETFQVLQLIKRDIIDKHENHSNIQIYLYNIIEQTNTNQNLFQKLEEWKISHLFSPLISLLNILSESNIQLNQKQTEFIIHLINTLSKRIIDINWKDKSYTFNSQFVITILNLSSSFINWSLNFLKNHLLEDSQNTNENDQKYLQNNLQISQNLFIELLDSLTTLCSNINHNISQPLVLEDIPDFQISLDLDLDVDLKNQKITFDQIMESFNPKRSSEKPSNEVDNEQSNLQSILLELNTETLIPDQPLKQTTFLSTQKLPQKNAIITESHIFETDYLIQFSSSLLQQNSQILLDFLKASFLKSISNKNSQNIQVINKLFVLIEAIPKDIILSDVRIISFFFQQLNSYLLNFLQSPHQSLFDILKEFLIFLMYTFPENLNDNVFLLVLLQISQFFDKNAIKIQDQLSEIIQSQTIQPLDIGNINEMILILHLYQEIFQDFFTLPSIPQIEINQQLSEFLESQRNLLKSQDLSEDNKHDKQIMIMDENFNPEKIKCEFQINPNLSFDCLLIHNTFESHLSFLLSDNNFSKLFLNSIFISVTFTTSILYLEYSNTVNEREAEKQNIMKNQEKEKQKKNEQKPAFDSKSDDESSVEENLQFDSLFDVFFFNDKKPEENLKEKSQDLQKSKIEICTPIYIDFDLFWKITDEFHENLIHSLKQNMNKFHLNCLLFIGNIQQKFLPFEAIKFLVSNFLREFHLFLVSKDILSQDLISYLLQITLQNHSNFFQISLENLSFVARLIFQNQLKNNKKQKELMNDFDNEKKRFRK
eukprot:Anaeramoba_ignava/a1214_45.p1 GENE.a1214_45~~a1214_45.p1  ORF type:complete len:780 (-),score=225.46 a1214_45:279-2618(-)